MNKKKKDRLYFFWSAAILLCLLLVLFALIFVSCHSDLDNPEPDGTSPPSEDAENTDETAQDPETSAQTSESPLPQQEPEETEHVDTPTTLLAETEDMGQEYIDKIIFFGDSTTNGLRVYGMLSGGQETTQVWTPANGTYSLFRQSVNTILYPETGEELTIEEIVPRKMPEYMVITLGVNGVAMMSEESFKSDYSALVERILACSPETKIMLNSIYPVGRSYEYLNDINNEKIVRANGWIYDLCVEMQLRYLDSASVLKDDEGWLPSEYDNGDGLHLNPEAFTLVLNYIRTHGYK